MNTRLRPLIGLLVALFFVLVAADARAAGTFKLKNNEVNEVGGGWVLYVTIELPKAPLTAHQSMKFQLTKTVAYERSLIDGRSEPVLNRQVLQNQTPQTESVDVNFADASGKIFKGTRFDFKLTRPRGYEAGEYTVELKTSDGVLIGGKQNLTLKGDNEVVDRRSIAFNAKTPGIKKVDGQDVGPKKGAQNDDVPAAAPLGGEVTPTGTATGFVPADGYKETDEEKIKTRPSGCGCSIPGASSPVALLYGIAPLVAFAIFTVRRRRRG